MGVGNSSDAENIVGHAWVCAVLPGPYHHAAWSALPCSAMRGWSLPPPL